MTADRPSSLIDPVCGMNVDAARAGEVRSGRLAELVDPCRRAVVGVAGTHRVGSCLDHVRRSLEVRLADLEMDDVTPLSLELPRAGEHAERRLRAEALEAVCETGKRACAGVAHAHDSTRDQDGG